MYYAASMARQPPAGWRGAVFCLLACGLLPAEAQQSARELLGAQVTAWQSLESVEFYWTGAYRYLGPRGKNPYRSRFWITPGLFRWRRDGAYRIDSHEPTSSHMEKLTVAELRGRRYSLIRGQLVVEPARGLTWIDPKLWGLFPLPLYRQLHEEPQYSLRLRARARKLGTEVVILVAELRSAGGELVERWQIALARKGPAFLASASRYGPSGQLETEYEAIRLGQFRTATGRIVPLVTECAVRYYLFRPPAEPKRHLVLKKPWSEWQIKLVPGTVRLGRSIPDRDIAVPDPDEAVALEHSDREVRIGRAALARQPTTAGEERLDTNQIGTLQRIARVEDELPNTDRWAWFLTAIGILAIAVGLLRRWRVNRGA